MAHPLVGLETIRYPAHWRRMTKEKSKEAKAFKKPAHWTNDPAPEPKAAKENKRASDALSPTRYGDWVKDGIAIDF